MKYGVTVCVCSTQKERKREKEKKAESIVRILKTRRRKIKEDGGVSGRRSGTRKAQGPSRSLGEKRVDGRNCVLPSRELGF